MHYRDLGKTGLKVSEVSMGCNRLGGDDASPEHWEKLVKRAADLGVNLFDTAEAYGKGKSEEVLGRALKGREDVYIASKFSPPRTDAGKDCSSKFLIVAAERSLKRLRRSCIEVFQVHSPTREELEHSDWADGMARLKAEGKIRCAAVAIQQPDEGVWLIEEGVAEVLQVTYNLFETEVADRLLPLAAEHGVGTLVRMPLARGVLTGKFRVGESIPNGFRAAMDGEKALDRLKLVETLRPVTDSYPGGLAHLALHFSLSHPGVSCIIPGARSVEQLEQNVSASNGSGLADMIKAEIDCIRASWIA